MPHLMFLNPWYGGQQQQGQGQPGQSQGPPGHPPPPPPPPPGATTTIGPLPGSPAIRDESRSIRHLVTWSHRCILHVERTDAAILNFLDSSHDLMNNIIA